jgi:hypothetical protein
MQFLSDVPDGLTLQDLNTRFQAWVKEYHTSEHSSTKETPLARYIKHIHLIREAPGHLMDHFRKRVVRKVDKDRTISLNGRLYEAPVELIGRTVTLLYHENDPVRVEILYNSISHGMAVPLDVHINVKVKRAYQAMDIIPEREHLSEEKKYRGGQLFGGEES